MSTFIAEHLAEIFFGLISAGLLALCKHWHNEIKKYRKMLEEKKNDALEEMIESRIEPIKAEIEELRKYIRDTGAIEKSHMDLIVSSYRFRLVQLCRAYLTKGFMTQSEYDQLVEFYKVYTGLGGNGQAREYYEKATKLEIRQNSEQ